MESNTTLATEVELTITFVDAAMCAFCLACMVFVCGGNVLTIVAIIRTQALRTLANVYVISLAVADLIVGLGFGMLAIFMLPPYKDELYDRRIHSCVFMQGTILGTVVTSSFHMVLISFDRYIYITRPYLYQRIFTKRNVTLFLAAIWTFCLFMFVTPQYAHNDTSKIRDCDLTKSLTTWYLFYLNVLIYALNVLVVVIIYSQILLAALRQRRAIQATAATVYVKPQNKSEKENEEGVNKSKKAWKSIKFFFTIFGFYFVCVTPSLVSTSLDIYAQHLILETIYRITTLVVMLNSGMNFIIYAVMNRHFKQAFADILRCRPSSQ